MHYYLCSDTDVAIISTLSYMACHFFNGKLVIRNLSQGGLNVNSDRPINLDLTKFKFPLMAIASILHRISGVVLFIFLPFLLYLLHASLLSQSSFLDIQQFMKTPIVKLIMWGIVSAVGYHLLAGIRHLIMDLGYFEGLKSGKATAMLLFILAGLVVILAGVWIW